MSKIVESIIDEIDFRDWFEFLPQRLVERVVGRIGKITFKIYPKENRPNEIPHIHVSTDVCDAVFQIEDGEPPKDKLVSGRLTSEEKKLIKQWILKNQEKLMILWNNSTSSPIVFDLEQYYVNGSYVYKKRFN